VTAVGGEAVDGEVVATVGRSGPIDLDAAEGIEGIRQVNLKVLDEGFEAMAGLITVLNWVRAEERQS
jgi:hypothetical protein